MRNLVCATAILAAAAQGWGQRGQSPSQPSAVWVADQGDGTYRNPVLNADYSDPDVIRVGDKFYLVSSSFNESPGLPLLESRDLVNWRLIGHAISQQPPVERFRSPQHGGGVWAPTIRYHRGQYFVYYPDPDVGIYMTKAKAVGGPWSPPLLIKAAPGWIDPCPLWDDDGKAYLVNALAASRSGAKSVIVVSAMDPSGTKLLDDGAIVIDGHADDPTLEGPKLYKRHGYFYIFAPAGGVPTGWETVFRSKSIYGPYERRKTLAQGDSSTNGPHQGAWVTTRQGEDWFLHFQDRGAYGRVVHLEPMKWVADWPVMGEKVDVAGLGQPVATYRKPNVPGPVAIATPPDSDEFNAPQLGLQWQWEANPQPTWAFPSKALGALRLIDIPVLGGEPNLWNVPNLLLQKFPATAFTTTTKVKVTPRNAGEETGLVVYGESYAYVGLKNEDGHLQVREVVRQKASEGGTLSVAATASVNRDVVYLRARVDAGAIVTFSYSLDDSHFKQLGIPFQAVPGRWVGAKIGLFAVGPAGGYERGYADYDWFRFTR